MLPRPTIEAFDRCLIARSLRFEAIVIGGSALALLGVTDRQTRDFDILHPKLPKEIIEVSRAFAVQLRGEGVELTDDWLNNGPMPLADLLPSGWRLRVQGLFTGKALTLSTLGRDDLLKTKLFALCDRGTDLADCIALAPTANELKEAEPWLSMQDTNPMWPQHVHSTIDDLQERIDHGV